MGAWGVGVFDNDDALDVRDDFRELVGAGYSSEDATVRLIELGRIDDASDSAGAWIALALTQWKTGRLLDWVRDRALAAIDAGPEAQWIDPKDVKRRRVVLEQTRAQLLSAQRSPVRIRRERASQSPFVPGDVLRFTCASGREVALWAIENDRHESLTTVSINTLFQLRAFGAPALPAVSEWVAREPVVLTSDEGYRTIMHVHLMLPQEAVGANWTVIANVPFPAAQRGLGHNNKLEVKTADATFEEWYPLSLVVDPSAIAVQRLVDALPNLPGPRTGWTGWPLGKAHDIGLHITDALATGDAAGVRGALAVLDELIADGHTPEAAAVVDVILTSSTHPEVGLARDDALAHLGPRARSLIPEIDASWANQQIVDKRPLQLDDERYATLTGGINLHQARNMRSLIRRLPDGCYATKYRVS